MTNRSSRLKRKLELQTPLCIKKKLRSNLRRRRRFQISPVLLASKEDFEVSGENPRVPVVSVDSSSCSSFNGEVSCNSKRKGRSNTRKKIVGEAGSSRKDQCDEFWRNRRFEKQNDSEVEVSESSCVDSNSGVRKQRSLILKFRSGKESENVKETVTNEGSEACTKSETTCELQCSGGNSKSGAANIQFSSEIAVNDVVSACCGVSEIFEKLGEETIRGKENRSSDFEFSQVSGNHHADENKIELNQQSSIKQGSNHFVDDSDLACTEQLSYEDVSMYSSSQETAFSDLYSELFPECSELEISDYFTDSGSQFTEGSVGETPSPTFSLFIQFKDEFSTLPSPDTGITLCVEDDTSLQAEFLKFEDQEDEEGYQMLRKRERRQVFYSNYAEKYSNTEYGKLVLQQRSQMIYWIVEQSCRKELRHETMFLGVSLLDRFLSKGFFKTRRNLQIVGIACLTLATRIEENQPHNSAPESKYRGNSVRQKNFCIGSCVYSRCEVVAMEWIVQEVLSFQCFLPTIYNFLWFYLKAARADPKVEKRVKFLAVLALSSHEQLCYWPSTVAAALVILGCLELNQNGSHKVIGIHVRSKDENLHKCIEGRKFDCSVRVTLFLVVNWP
ncbi:cyclin-SDS [Senna tora]|uniref:B-like cyclin n=1 Tax=Senna tora TaxID=362788 RepID=A0A834TVX6_9FABA|nr:cyclin-SDS [Senna tora]